MQMTRITAEMYDKYLHEYKGKQAELTEQMQDHSDADEQFYVTANMTLNLAKRARAIFNSSEVDEKRQFLTFLLQNCTLQSEKLAFTMRSPFDVMFSNTHHMTMRKWLDALRTLHWKEIKRDLEFSGAVWGLKLEAPSLV